MIETVQKVDLSQKSKKYTQDQKLLEEMINFTLEKFKEKSQKIPKMFEFHYSDFIEENYYKRHLLETILRIRENNKVDSYCLYKASQSDDWLCAKLAQYLAEEFSHDKMFLADLKKFGMTEDETNKSEVFRSTKALIGYIYQEVDKNGPMATMLWNWFVELYSDNFNSFIKDKAKAKFGKTYTLGVEAHLLVDDHEDHVGLMFTTVMRVIKTQQDIERCKTYIKDFIWFIGEYFKDLAHYSENN